MANTEKKKEESYEHQSKPPQALTAAERGPYCYMPGHNFPKPTE